MLISLPLMQAASVLKKSEGILTIVVCNPKDKKAAEDKPSKQSPFLFSFLFRETRHRSLRPVALVTRGVESRHAFHSLASHSMITGHVISGHACWGLLSLCFPFLFFVGFRSFFRLVVYRSRVSEHQTVRRWRLHEPAWVFTPASEQLPCGACE